MFQIVGRSTSKAFLLAAVVSVLCAVVGGCSLKDKIARHLWPAHAMTLKTEVNQGTAGSDLLVVKRLWPTTKVKSEVFSGNFWASPVLVRLPGKAPFLVVLPSSGVVAALDAASGKRLWKAQLPHADTETPELRAAPAQVGENLMVVYTTRNKVSGAVVHRAAMIDLRRGAVNPAFKPLTLTASAAAADGGRFDLQPEWHLPRAVTYDPTPGKLGHAYITFGADRDQGAWHGWLLEVDLDAWARGNGQVISSAFSTTSERDCDDGTEGKLCGGGLWAYGGAQIFHGPTGEEILVQTGNGRLDLARKSYSQAVLRLQPGLKFDPHCDASACGNTNQRDPSNACLATCRDLFVPRLLPTNPPPRPVDHSCDKLTYMECLEFNDWDLGSVSPVRVQAGGRSFYVTAGKGGDVFLIDADRMGLLYDRVQVLDLCGAPADPCPDQNSGLIITQPVVATLDGEPVVVIPSFNRDATHAAGVTAYRVRITDKGPKLKVAWRVPDPASPQARQWFRAPPTRPVLQMLGSEPVVWVADNARDGHLLGIRVRDGKVLADIAAGGWPMRNSKPVIYNNVLYLPAAVQGHDDLTWIEAYSIGKR